MGICTACKDENGKKRVRNNLIIEENIQIVNNDNQTFKKENILNIYQILKLLQKLLVNQLIISKK